MISQNLEEISLHLKHLVDYKNNQATEERTYDHAGLGPRACAYMIDLICFALLFATLSWDLRVYLLGIALLAMMEAAACRATPGKWLMGLQVLWPYEDRPPWILSAFRNIAKVASHIFLFGFVFALARSDRRTWHDLVAGSRVVVSKRAVISPARRVVALLLVASAVAALAGAMVYSKLEEMLPSTGIVQWMMGAEPTPPKPEEIVAILQRDHGITLPRESKVIASKLIPAWQPFLLVAISSQEGGSSGASIWPPEALADYTGTPTVLLLLVAQDDVTQPLDAYKTAMRNQNAIVQTVHHAVGAERLSSSKFVLDRTGGKTSVVYLSALSPQLAIVAIGPEASFDLQSYLQIALQAKK